MGSQLRLCVQARQLTCAGFIPNSQLASDTQPKVGTAVQAAFIEVDESKPRMVLSPKRADVLRFLTTVHRNSIVKV